MRVELSKLTARQFSLCDAHLEGFRWLEEGRDVRFDLTNGFGQKVQLTCTWVSALKIELEPKSQPFSWECTVAEVGNRWKLQLDFASAGDIWLECETAILESALGD